MAKIIIPSSRPQYKLTHQQREQIAARYLSGERTNALAKEFGITHHAVRNILKSRDIQPRPKTPNCLSVLKANHNVFSDTSPEMSYWVGFLMADGCVSDKRNTVKLGLAAVDEAHVLKFKNFTKSEHKVLKYTAKKLTKGKTLARVCEISIPSVMMVADLSKFGVTPRKSYTAKVIGLENDRDFWRGMIDGDGSITTNNGVRPDYPQINFCGSRACCEQFLAYTMSIYKSKNSVYKEPRAKDFYKVHISGTAAIVIIKHLYEGATVYLDRKYEKAHRLIRAYEAYLANLKSNTPSHRYYPKRYAKYYAAINKTTSETPPTLNPGNAADPVANPET